MTGIDSFDDRITNMDTHTHSFSSEDRIYLSQIMHIQPRESKVIKPSQQDVAMRMYLLTIDATVERLSISSRDKRVAEDNPSIRQLRTIYFSSADTTTCKSSANNIPVGMKF